MKNPLKIVFFGSPQFAIPSLQELHASKTIEIAAVISQPDRPAGRGRKLSPPAVKEFALKFGIEIRQPKSIRGKKFGLWLRQLEADYFVVAAYGKILPASVLDIPRLGCVNLHSSLLPSYRGAAPVNWALVHGETSTGVTTMLMDEGLDTGPVLLQQEVEIHPGETAGELTIRLAQAGAPLLIKTLLDFAEGKLEPRVQRDDISSLAPLINKEDGKVDWNLTATNIFHRWQGFTPWPGIHAGFRGNFIKLLQVAVAVEVKPNAPPGSLLVCDEKLFAACSGNSTLEILSVQLPGKKTIAAADFIRGYRIKPGEKFERAAL